MPVADRSAGDESDRRPPDLELRLALTRTITRGAGVQQETRD
jgi:hypothetical protein